MFTPTYRYFSPFRREKMKRGKEEWGRHKGERKSSRFCDKKGDD
jgi:hypothetical protein